MHSATANTVCCTTKLLEFLCCLLMTPKYDYSFVQTSGTDLIDVMYFYMTYITSLQKKVIVGRKYKAVMLPLMYHHCFLRKKSSFYVSQATMILCTNSQYYIGNTHIKRHGTNSDLWYIHTVAISIH